MGIVFVLSLWLNMYLCERPFLWLSQFASDFFVLAFILPFTFFIFHPAFVDTELRVEFSECLKISHHRSGRSQLINCYVEVFVGIVSCSRKGGQ